MRPIPTKDATHVFRKPEGWDQTADGECSDLSVRVQRYNDGNRMECVSTWKPSPAELALLNEGGVVILSVVGRQPPVALHVEPFDMPIADTSAAPKDAMSEPDEDHLDRERAEADLGDRDLDDGV